MNRTTRELYTGLEIKDPTSLGLDPRAPLALKGNYFTYTSPRMFGVGGLFMKWIVYVPEGRNEGGRVATPTSFSIFDSYDMKSLRFRFGHGINNSLASKWQCPNVGMPVFS